MNGHRGSVERLDAVISPRPWPGCRMLPHEPCHRVLSIVFGLVWAVGGGPLWIHQHSSNCSHLSVCLVFSVQAMEGGLSSQKTPLGCFLRHFKEGFVEGADYGIKFSPGGLRTLCEVEWLSFGVNWPPEGSFDGFSEEYLEDCHGRPRTSRPVSLH